MVSGTASSTGNTVTLVAVPAAAATVATQCSSATVAAAEGFVVTRSANSAFFDYGRDDSDSNPTYFQGVAAGDIVTAINLDRGAGSPAFVVNTVDPATTNAKAVHFKTGSAPNGGGMYPIIPNHAAWPTATASFNTPSAAGLPFSTGTVLQATHNSGATEDAFVDTATAVERVLEELPNQVIEDVSVAMTSAATGLYAFSVTFSGARDPGNQHEIIMNSKGCDVDGCHPRYSGVRVQSTFLVNEKGDVAASGTDKAPTTFGAGTGSTLALQTGL